jgi:hypothetical protein
MQSPWFLNVVQSFRASVFQPPFLHWAVLVGTVTVIELLDVKHVHINEPLLEVKQTLFVVKVLADPEPPRMKNDATTGTAKAAPRTYFLMKSRRSAVT